MLRLTLSMMLWIAPAEAPTPSLTPSQKALQAANDARDEGRYDAAVTLTKKAVKLDPTHVAAQISLATLYARTGDLAKEAAAYQAALSTMDEGHGNRAEIALRLGSVTVRRSREPGLSAVQRTRMQNDAIAAFDIAIASRPSDHKAYFRRALVHQGLSDPDAADADLRRCIRRAPTYARCFVELAILYSDYGFHESALAVLDAGIKENDHEAELWAAVGRVRTELRQPAPAVEAFEKAEAIDPTAIEVMFGLGLAFASNGNTADAIATLERFVAAASASAVTHADQGRIRAARDAIARLSVPG